MNDELDENGRAKPPSYLKIKSNILVRKAKFKSNKYTIQPCSCPSNGEDPCGPSSNCTNRAKNIECHPSVCPTGERCKNQAFQKRRWAKLKPFPTPGKGWGLKTLQRIKKGLDLIWLFLIMQAVCYLFSGHRNECKNDFLLNNVCRLNSSKSRNVALKDRF
jgi:hypothetical protein